MKSLFIMFLFGTIVESVRPAILEAELKKQKAIIGVKMGPCAPGPSAPFNSQKW